MSEKDSQKLSFSPGEKAFFLLQVNDPTFPIGAYSHSLGLETYISKEIITDAEDTLHYLQTNLKTSFKHIDLLAVSLAMEYTGQGGAVEKLVRLNVLLDALKAPKELREASQRLGIRFNKTVLEMFPKLKDTIYGDFIQASKEKGVELHYPVVYGAMAGILELDKNEALAAFLYSNVSGIVTNAAKSVPISQTSGQNIIAKLYPLFSELVEEVQDLDEDDLGFSTPGFDIRSMQHEVLYTRLYIS